MVLALYVDDIIVFVFTIIAFIFMLVVRKQDSENLKGVKLFIIVGLANLGLIIFNFVYNSSYYFSIVMGLDYNLQMESILIYLVGYNIIAYPLVNIITFGVIPAFIGYKNGADKEGHLFIIAAVFFVMSQCFNIAYQAGYYYYFTSPIYISSISFVGYSFPSLIFSLLGNIYFIKFSAKNKDTFRTLYGSFAILIMFLPLIMNFFRAFSYFPYYY